MTTFKKMAFTQFSKLPQPSLQKAREDLMGRISLNADQKKLNDLSALLNAIVNSNKFKEEQVASKILSKLPQIVQQGSSQAISNLRISSSLGVYTQESAQAWSDFATKSKEYKMAVEQGIDDLSSLLDEVDALKSRALSLQGSLNALSGQAFESLLQVLIPVVKDNVKDIAKTGTKELLSILDKTQQIATQGTSTETATFTIGDKETRIVSKGKIDVQARSPFLTEDDLLKISAKNYSQLRDIHLLSGGSVVGLISAWPVDNDTKNYYYNALGVWHPDNYLQEARLLFAIQALAGKGGQNEMSNVLILNIRSRANPISVISIKSLLEGIERNPVKDEKAFNMIFNTLPVFQEGEKRTDESEFHDRIRSITLDTTLNKAYLKLQYISKLQ